VRGMMNSRPSSQITRMGIGFLFEDIPHNPGMALFGGYVQRPASPFTFGLDTFWNKTYRRLHPG
jgi:hypothetical protein